MKSSYWLTLAVAIAVSGLIVRAEANCDWQHQACRFAQMDTPRSGGAASTPGPNMPVPGFDVPCNAGTQAVWVVRQANGVNVMTPMCAAVLSEPLPPQ